MDYLSLMPVGRTYVEDKMVFVNKEKWWKEKRSEGKIPNFSYD